MTLNPQILNPKPKICPLDPQAPKPPNIDTPALNLTPDQMGFNNQNGVLHFYNSYAEFVLRGLIQATVSSKNPIVVT